MKFLDQWREERDRQFVEKWEREHRWDALARYNAEVRRGLVHRPGWDAIMAAEQAKFDQEVNGGAHTGFPVTLESGG